MTAMSTEGPKAGKKLLHLTLGEFPFEELGLGSLRACFSETRKLSKKQGVILYELLTYWEDHPKQYDSRIVAKMKHIGMKRPDWVKAEDWNGEKPALQSNPMYSIVSYMAAWGLPSSRIAKDTGLHRDTVIKLLKDDDFKKEVKDIQFKIWGQDPKNWIRSLIPEAIQVEADVMRNTLAKPAVRLAAAQDILDRGMGKAPQTLNVQDSGLRKVLEALDRMQRPSQAQLRETIEADFQDLGSETPRGEPADLPPPAPETAMPVDDIDLWVGEHLCPSDLNTKKP